MWSDPNWVIYTPDGKFPLARGRSLSDALHNARIARRCWREFYRLLLPIDIHSEFSRSNHGFRINVSR